LGDEFSPQLGKNDVAKDRVGVKIRGEILTVNSRENSVIMAARPDAKPALGWS
jgi:hypothetical protein